MAADLHIRVHNLIGGTHLVPNDPPDASRSATSIESLSSVTAVLIDPVVCLAMRATVCR